ncbi:MAG: hypothetical protein Q8K99_00405 [Actinomycetota bacterium]|nr:hypothetical protein [Actinomycetota bacterium]
MTLRRLLTFAAAILLAAAGGDAAAQESSTLAIGWGMNGRATTSGRPSVEVASASRVADEVGSVRYEVTCPTERNPDGSLDERIAITDQRGVRITLSKPGFAYRDMAILSFLLDEGLRRAWNECVILNGMSGEDGHSVGWIEISGSTPSDATTRPLVRAEKFVGGVFHTWGEVIDVEFDRQKEAAAAAQATEREAQAQATRQAQYQAQQNAGVARAVERENQRQESQRAAETAFGWFKLLLAVGAVWALWSARIPILRAWYGLTPHPAQTAVQDAIASGQRVDVNAVRASLGLQGANAVEQSVREQQLKEATDLLKAHHAQLNAEAANRVAEAERRATQRAQAERDYDLGKAEADLLKAVLEHQTAAARVEALRKRSTKDD